MYNISKEKLYKPFSNDVTNTNFVDFLKRVLAPDKNFLLSIIVYGLAISILGLASPISVQLLINSVSFTATFQPVLILGLILLFLVIIFGIANIMQFYISELFQRRFFARMSASVGMSLLNAQHQTFEEANQTEMVNRFFETTMIQKTIPKLLGKTFNIVLQSAAGLLLIAFYHPFFLLFTVGIPLIVFFIWKAFSQKAIGHSFLESRRKYDVAGWLEDIARNDLLFKSSAGRNYAKFKIDFLTGLYLKERKLHFRGLFSQTILLFLLHALLTALLLILGGWLVLKGQLSIGQLVASELVISVILYNISNLGSDFESFYDLIASCEKLSQFQNIPEEKSKGEQLPEQINEINFEDVSYHYGSSKYHINLKFLNEKNYLIFTSGYSTRKILIEMLQGLRSADLGIIKINGTDVNIFDKYDLRSRIAIIDNSPLIEGTVREYLTFNDENISDNYVMTILENIGVAEKIINSKEGLNLRIIPSGWPFLETEKILLKVARALISKPQIIIADEVLDMLEQNIRKRILFYLTKQEKATFIYFSHHFDDSENFDHKILVEKTHSKEVTKIEEIYKL